MSISEEELALICVALEEDEINETGEKQMWIHPINKERLTCEFQTLMPQLRKDKNRFHIYFRMPMECCDEILGLISFEIQKCETSMRECIAPEERLDVPLRLITVSMEN